MKNREREKKKRKKRRRKGGRKVLWGWTSKRSRCQPPPDRQTHLLGLQSTCLRGGRRSVHCACLPFRLRAPAPTSPAATTYTCGVLYTPSRDTSDVGLGPAMWHPGFLSLLLLYRLLHVDTSSYTTNTYLLIH
ncbi:hypothetical protein LX36DRAFT_103503 [Colletotrichum falcatum]|nr:hypothetical protein LX36DRAFT_103503 [Colletotrichum falcatum]